MKMNEKCLPCLINQVIKVACMTNAHNREELYKRVFEYLSQEDFSKTNPEIIGSTFKMLKQHIHNDDPYLKIRNDYNELFLKMSDDFLIKINQSDDPFYKAVLFAVMGNIIDFNPIHNHNEDDIMNHFKEIDKNKLYFNDIEDLKDDILSSQTLLYIGDNCGEICLDKILIMKIKELNPNLDIYFGVRGYPIVNDSIEADAYKVHMDDYANIISNGDDSLGTIIHRTHDDFKAIYHKADFVISKGQANYESLSDEHKNIYFMLMIKCDVIAQYIGAPEKSMVLKRQQLK